MSVKSLWKSRGLSGLNTERESSLMRGSMNGRSHPKRGENGSALPSRIAVFLASCLLATSSCSTIVGTIKPVDEKSEDYSAIDLAREYPGIWKKLEEKQLVPRDAEIGSNTDAFSSEITDVAYQSTKTAAIISLNSSCRQGREQVINLSPVLRELLLGMTEVEERTEAPMKVSGVPALGSTVEGKMAGERTKIRAVVLSKDECVYDLMYISRPNRFKVHEDDFNRFVSSFKLR